jgi:hypothetical protein
MSTVVAHVVVEGYRLQAVPFPADSQAMTTRRAGTYARDRYTQALARYRRRMRVEFLGLLVAGFGITVAVGLVRGLDWWSYSAGAAAGGLVGLAVWLRDEPPEFIAKWGRGAAGEERTGKELTLLLDEGWQVRHDVELHWGGNVDHVLRSPSGRAFVLETKSLAGAIALEHGQLTSRFVDDPAEVRRQDLTPRMLALADRVHQMWSKRANGSAPAVEPIVVIWGAFEHRMHVDRGVVYVRGDALVSHLRATEMSL